MVAVAVPLDIEQRNVFVSYNFEANYGLPTDPSTFKPVNWFSTNDIRSVLKRSLINRKSVYALIRDKLRLHGFSGNSCLLRMICEISKDPIADHNGLYGDIFHIIFTPSSSVNETISRRYYDAEVAGKRGGCQEYYAICPHTFLDWITDVDDGHNLNLTNFN